MTKKHKKIIAAVIVIILAFLALMYCKIIPSIMVSKAISAINNDDVSAYKKYSSMIGNFPYSFGKDDVSAYLRERETDAADEVNEKFQDFETTSEIEEYVKDNYRLIYRCCLKDDKGWGIINSRIDSNQKCIELKEEVEELSQSVEISKSLLEQYPQWPRKAQKERLQASLEIEMTVLEWAGFDFWFDNTYDGVQSDLTYINKIKPIVDEIRTDVEKIEQEKGELDKNQ